MMPLSLESPPYAGPHGQLPSNPSLSHYGHTTGTSATADSETAPRRWTRLLWPLLALSVNPLHPPLCMTLRTEDEARRSDAYRI